MGTPGADNVQVVAVITGLDERYWAAAVAPEKAVQAVLQVAPPGSEGRLTKLHLTPEQLAALDLQENGVRDLGYMPIDPTLAIED